MNNILNAGDAAGAAGAAARSQRSQSSNSKYYRQYGSPKAQWTIVMQFPWTLLSGYRMAELSWSRTQLIVIHVLAYGSLLKYIYVP